MKKILSVFLSALIIATVLIPTGYVGAENAGGNVVNGDFEQGDWQYKGKTVSGATVAYTMNKSVGNGRNGSDYLLGVNRTKAVASANAFEASSKTVADATFSPDKEYVLSFWVKTDGDFKGCVYVRMSNSSKNNIIGTSANNYILGNVLSSTYATINFGEYRQVFSTPFKIESNEQMGVTIGVNGTGIIFFDDVEIIENPDSGNLIKNGGFEEGNWSASGTTPLREYKDTDNSLAAQKLSGGFITANVTNADPAKAYTFSLSLKAVGMAENAAYARVMQVREDGSSSWIRVNSEEDLAKTGGTTDWKKYSFEITDLSKNLKGLVVYIYAEGEGYLLVDNVRFAEVAPYEEVPAGEVRSNLRSGEIARNSVVHLFSADGGDIYYTTDGTNPTVSLSRYLYDGSHGIIITENTVINAVAAGSDKVFTAAYITERLIPDGGFENGLWNKAAGAQIALDTANAAEGKQSMKITSGSADTGYLLIDDNFEYTLSFKVKTSGMSQKNAAYVALFLKGTGIERRDGDIGVYYGDRYGVFETETDQDWTYYSLPLYNLKGYSKIVIEAGIKDGESGTAYFDGFKLSANAPKDYALYTSAGGDVNGNIYTEKTATQKIVITNRAENAQNGTLKYTVADNDGKVLKTGEQAVTVAGGADYQLNADISAAESYGLYTVDVTMTEQDGYSYAVGTTNFSLVRDASDTTRNDLYDGAGDRILNSANHAVFGVSSHAMTGGYLNNKTDRASIDKYMDMLKKAGVTSLREEVLWYDIEKTKGVYQFPSFWDDYVDSAIAHGMEVMFCLNGGNSLYLSGDFPKTETEIAAFSSFAAAVAQKFNGRVYHYELFNETNFTRVCTAAEYVEALKGFNSAIKAVNSDNKSIAGVLSLCDAYYTRGILEAGGAEYMDIYSFHPYVDEFGTGEPENKLADGIKSIKKAFTDYNITKDIPFWFTEIGYSTGLCWRGKTEENQANYHIRANAVSDAFDYADRYFLYETLGYTYPYSLEAGWGMLESPFSGADAYTAKQPFVAFAAKNAILDGYSFDSRVNTSNVSSANVYMYKYTNPNAERDVYLIWTDNKAGVAELKVSAGNVLVTDFYGNDRAPHYGRDGATLNEEISGRILYITTEKNAQVTLSGFALGAKSGSDMTDSIIIPNGDFENGVWEMWSNVSSTVTDESAGKGKSAKFTFAEENSNHTLFVSVLRSDFTEKLDVTKKYRVNISAKATEGYRGKVFVRAREKVNGSERAIKPNLWNGEWYLFGRNTNNNETYKDGFMEISKEWSTFSTEAFALTGPEIFFEICVFGEGGTLWLDDISFTPVEITETKGTVTASFDKESGNYTLKATADKGYELSHIEVYSGLGEKPSTIPAFAAKTGVLESEYTYNIDDVTVVGNIPQYGLPYVKAVFVKAENEVTLPGDADNNGVTDIRDLVRVKKYSAGITQEIELYNADIVADGYILSNDIATLRKYLLS